MLYKCHKQHRFENAYPAFSSLYSSSFYMGYPMFFEKSKKVSVPRLGTPVIGTERPDPYVRSLHLLHMQPLDPMRRSLSSLAYILAQILQVVNLTLSKFFDLNTKSRSLEALYYLQSPLATDLIFKYAVTWTWVNHSQHSCYLQFLRESDDP